MQPMNTPTGSPRGVDNHPSLQPTEGSVLQLLAEVAMRIGNPQLAPPLPALRSQNEAVNQQQQPTGADVYLNANSNQANSSNPNQQNNDLPYIPDLGSR